MNKIAIIDYGSSNLKSVYNAFEEVSKKYKKKIIVTHCYKDLAKASHIVLPGVGSFESCISGLKKSSLINELEHRVITLKIPFLGVCVGMQMLANIGYEKGVHEGLGWIKGSVKRIKTNNTRLKIPHMGWNELKINETTPFISLLKKKICFEENKSVSAYFVHSYNFNIENNNQRTISAFYGEEITAMISSKNILGTQFHPEKSHLFGLKFLETFIECEEF